MQAPTMAMGRPYAARPYAQEEPEQKEITTEQIQAMLDENSSLIVEIIGLNNQIKHGKGTAQLGEFTEKLDKKRKQLNKNLMTLAKWADESSDSSPRPPPQAQYAQPPQHQQQMHHPQQQMHPHAHMQQAQQQYAARPGMSMNMGMHPHMGGSQMASQSQMQQVQARYSQAQAHIQAQALAQYQARVAAQMGSQASQYMQMNPAMVQHQQQQQQQQQQQRYDPVMTGYGNPQQQQQQGMVNPMAMAPPQSYGGYQMPNAYAMMPPQQQQQQQQQQVPPMRMNMPSPGAPNGQAQLSPGPSAGMQRPGNQ